MYSATGVSVGRLIVYYYRIAPTNVDRTWDIGIVISIAEPAVHVITACAPATKGLFRILFPSFNSDYATYDERYAPYTASSSKGPCPQTAPLPKTTSGSHTTSSKTRSSMGFNFGLSSKDVEEGQDVIITERSHSPRGQDVYGMKKLGSVDSREEYGHHDDYESSTNEARARANIEYSKGDGDIVEPRPKHIFGLAR